MQNWGQAIAESQVRHVKMKVLKGMIKLYSRNNCGLVPVLKRQKPAGLKCGSRGGQGVRNPPEKSQVIWVSIGNKQ